MSENKSVFGLDEKLAGVVSYAGLWVTGLIVLIFERDNKKVKFNAMQSFIFFGFLCLVKAIAGYIPFIGGLIGSILGLLILVSWMYLMYNAYKGIEFRIPIIGDVIYNQIYSK